MEKTNPLWFMGLKNPRKIGYYSGTKRDFQLEFESEEVDGDNLEMYLPDDPDSAYNDPDFREDMEELWQRHMAASEEEFTKHSKVYAVAQSHIDIAWKWRLGQSIKKSRHTFGKAVRHCELFSNFSFSASQPALFEMVEKTDPQLFEKITGWVKEGRFEIVGACWTEPDPRMPSGEAFVRQHLYGQRYYLRKFGKISEIAWFQDSFGYSIQMPQLSVRSGAKYFFTNKISSNKETLFPTGAFHWFSPDGSHMLSFWVIGGFHLLHMWKKYKSAYRMLKPGEKLDYDYTMDRPEELPIWSHEYLPSLGMFYGAGDGGHGPRGEEWATIRYFAENNKNVVPSKAIDFYKELEKVQDRLPNFHDELYYEFHRATLSTHHLVKFMNRKMEWQLQGLENLASIAMIQSNFRYPFERLTRLWKNACTLHMHDILPGSSIPEVYDDCYDLWELFSDWRNEIASNIVDSLSQHAELSSGKSGVMIINPLPINRTDLVEFPLDEHANWEDVPIGVKDLNGKIWPVQRIDADDPTIEVLERKKARFIFGAQMPPLGISTLEFCNEKIASCGLSEMPPVGLTQSANQVVLENKFYILTVDKQTGAIESLKIKSSNKHIESLAGSSNILQGFIDILLSEPAWNFNPTYRKNPLDADDITHEPVQVVEMGPVRWTLEHKTKINSEDMGESTFIQRISMYADLEGIDCETDVDWHMNDISIKCFFDIAGDPQESIAEVSYGIIRRLLYPKANHDIPRWENNMQTFLTIPAKDGSFCFNIVNEGKFGFDNIEGKKIGITMIRGPRYPDVPGSSWVSKERINRSKAGEGEPEQVTDQGHHIIRLRLMPRAGAWDAQNIAPTAHAFNCPFLSKGIDYKPYATSFMSADSTGIEISSLKVLEEPNENLEAFENPAGVVNNKTFVLRVYETEGKHRDAMFYLPRNWDIQNVLPADLIERPTEEKIECIKNKKQSVEAVKAHWSPNEIKTFLLIR